jgi:hypothetical protein
VVTSHRAPEMIRFHAISHGDGGDLDGIHLLWSPPWPTGHSLDGFTIYRRDARGEKGQHCVELTPSALADARTAGYVALPDALVWADAQHPDDPTSSLWSYRAELTRRHSVVTVTASRARAAFVGTADGAIIGGAAFTGPTVTLRGSAIAIVWVVTDHRESSVIVCGDVPSDREWSNERPLVENLQVPFAAVNPDVGSTADGRTLADTRAAPEPFARDFEEVTGYATAALTRPGGVAAMRVVSERARDDGNAWDVSPYGLALAPTLLSPWRRAWGFAHLDRDDLTPGQRYDYRIVGTVPRRDRDEHHFDLHTVPRGYRLPPFFRWGAAFVWTSPAPTVRAIATSPGAPPTIRKGFDTTRLRLTLSAPTQRVVLDALPGSSVTAKGSRYGTAVASVTAATGPRTVLDFGTEVDTLLVEGDLTLAGITPHPVDAALDPDEPVPIAQTIYDIEFVPTAPPDPPASITVTNLSDPSRTAARGVHDMNRGVAVNWGAPPAIDPAALPYLPGSASAPPTEVSHYTLERTWAGRPFTAADGDGIHVSGRNAPTSTDTPGFGVDILRAFPPADAAPSSHSDSVHAIELFEPSTLAYGDEVTYRVHSVDAIGRLSTPRTSDPTPLRKFVRPPAPTTPPATSPVDSAAVPRSGVQVTLLQHDDPDLTAAQRDTAGGGDVVVVRWGWGPEQRDLDPDVVEFRVYRHDAPLTTIDVRPAGPPSPAPGGWSLPVTTSRPVAADEFAGVTAVLGTAFRVVGHGAGSATTLALAESTVDPARPPTPVPVTLNRTTSAELNSEYWDARVDVVPRTPAPDDTTEAYEVVLPAAWIATSGSTPRQRVAYGVTAADSESYVADRRLAIEPSPRPGNESTVAAAEVTARYFGRASLSVADLADVPVVTLPRQEGDDVHGSIRPADFLPTGATVASAMLLERLPAAAALRRVKVDAASISLVATDGTEHPWTLSSADADAIRDGHTAGLVPDRFAAHAAALLDGLDDDAVRLGVVNPTAPFDDTFPNRPSRWLYRVRAVDAASRPSANAQLLGVVVQVPSAARAVAPALVGIEVAAANATVTLDCSQVVGVPYVFLATDASLGSATASLATIRNRPDLDPIDRLVVRDTEGRAIPAIEATPDAGGVATVLAPVPAGGPVLHAWAIAVSPDGVPSRLVGPLHADATAV